MRARNSNCWRAQTASAKSSSTHECSGCDQVAIGCVAQEVLKAMTEMTEENEWFERIKKFDIEPDEIFSLVEEMVERQKTDDNINFETAMIILALRYKDQPGRALCITERMLCLNPMMKDERMRGWTIKTIDPNCTLTNYAVFRAVAKCPLRLDHDHTRLDPKEFFRIVLEESDSETTA